MLKAKFRNGKLGRARRLPRMEAVAANGRAWDQLERRGTAVSAQVHRGETSGKESLWNDYRAGEKNALQALCEEARIEWMLIEGCYAQRSGLRVQRVDDHIPGFGHQSTGNFQQERASLAEPLVADALR